MEKAKKKGRVAEGKEKAKRKQTKQKSEATMKKANKKEKEWKGRSDNPDIPTRHQVACAEYFAGRCRLRELPAPAYQSMRGFNDFLEQLRKWKKIGQRGQEPSKELLKEAACVAEDMGVELSDWERCSEFLCDRFIRDMMKAKKSGVMPKEYH